MASTTSTGTTLTSNFFLQNFYKYNRNAIKNSTRNDFTKTELSYEDTRALKRAVAKLSSFNYTEDENGDNIVSSIHAFIKTYNHTMDSTSSKSSDTYRQNQSLKELTKKYEKELKNIGISIEDNGKLSVKDNILRGSSFKEIGSVFSNTSDFMREIRGLARRLNDTSYDAVYAQMTGTGGRLNIIL